MVYSRIGDLAIYFKRVEENQVGGNDGRQRRHPKILRCVGRLPRLLGETGPG
jgi:hypothetical protein